MTAPRAAPRRRGLRAPVRLRRATLSDAVALARVQRAAVRGLARGSYGPRQVELWSRLGPTYYRWTLTAGGETAFVAERAGRVLGFAALRPGEVTAVFVLPSAARRGLGARLLSRVEREARRRGEARLVVRAALNAVPFYRASGFAGGRRIRVPLFDGAALDALLLAKRLAPPRPPHP